MDLAGTLTTSPPSSSTFGLVKRPNSLQVKPTFRNYVQSTIDVKSYESTLTTNSYNLSSSKPTIDRTMNQSLYESLTSSFLTPFDSLRRMTKSKLKLLKINKSVISNPAGTLTNSPSSSVNGMCEQCDQFSMNHSSLTQSLLNLLKFNSTTSITTRTNQSSEPTLVFTSMAKLDRPETAIKSRSNSLNCDSNSISKVILEPPSAFASRSTTPLHNNVINVDTSTQLNSIQSSSSSPSLTSSTTCFEDLYLERLNHEVIKKPNIVARYNQNGRIFYLK